MEFDFKFGHDHNSEVALLCCVDFRFREIALKWIEQEFGVEDPDLWTAPGCVKIFVTDEYPEVKAFYLEKIRDVSKGMHGIKKIVMVNHEDCGAYGERKAFETIALEKKKHLEDLREAKHILAEAVPDVEIIIAYADLNEEMTKGKLEIV